MRQQDAAGLAVFAGKVTTALAPRAEPSQVNAILETLEALAARRGDPRRGGGPFLAERARRRSAVMVFSDLLDRDERVLRLVADLRRRRHEVTVFHLLDPAELDFPFDDPTLFLSMEDDRSVEARGRDVRKGYLEDPRRAGSRRCGAPAGRATWTTCGSAPTSRSTRCCVPFLARRERSAA